MKKNEESIEKVLRNPNLRRMLASIKHLDMDLLDKINQLPFSEKNELIKYVDGLIERISINPLSLSTYGLHCPHCDSHKYVRNGITCGRQRYKCINCTKTFSIATNTSVHRLQKVEQWTNFVRLMLLSKNPLTIKELSEELSISIPTIHTWRHKLLAALNEIDDIKLKGEVEMDEVFLRFCVKGEKGKEKSKDVKKIEKQFKKKSTNAMFLCIHNREGDFNFQPLKLQSTGQVSSKLIKKAVEKLNIEEGTTVITDRSKGLTKYFKSRSDIKHETFKSDNSDNSKTDRLHNAHINSLMHEYKLWASHFRGYSTKYIWNYLNWYRFQNKFLNMITKENKKLEAMVKISVKDQHGYQRHTDIPMYYEEFIKVK